MKTLEEITKQIKDLKLSSAALAKSANDQLAENSQEMLRLEGELRLREADNKEKDIPIL